MRYERLMPQIDPANIAPDTPAPLKLGILAENLGFRFRRILEHISGTFRDQLSERNVKSGVFSALALIDANPGISQVELARIANFEKTTVVGLIDDLEQNGWARRTRNKADRRRHCLTITTEGQALLLDLSAMAIASERAITDALSASDLAMFSRTLDVICGSIEGMCRDPAQ